MLHRPDRLTSAELATGDRTGPRLARVLAQPQDAIATLTADLQALWDDHRSEDPNERRTGSLGLASGAYVQWIGYARRLVVEVSSNEFLEGPAQLTDAEQQTLLRAGFSSPDEDVPNFWLTVEERAECPRAAWAVVAVLTAVFGVYAG